MKNALTSSQGTATPRPAARWAVGIAQGATPRARHPLRSRQFRSRGAPALRTFDADLQRRGSAERTRKAYGTDAAELAAWATANALDPTQIDYKALRRWAARLSQQGAAPRTMARKLASARSLFRSLVEHGQITSNPADLLPAPKLPQSLPKVLKAEDIERLLEKIPASTPLAMRDRALFELAYSSGLRAEELVDLDHSSIEFDNEQVRVEGKGSKTRFVPVGEPALRTIAAYLERARPALLSRTRIRRFSCPKAVAGSQRAMCDADFGYGLSMHPRRPVSTHTRRGTPSPPTCWTEERICARFRRCWVTRVSRRPRSTLG